MRGRAGRVGRVRAGALRLSVAAALLGATACLGDDPTGPVDPEALNFAPALGVDLSRMTRTDSGLYLLDEVVGDGAEAVAGATVTVHYTGWLHDGFRFDSSHLPGRTPFGFGPLGAANVIAGWNEGVQGMREGGHRLLVIPSHLAYGAGGRAPSIPGHATLIFRVELLSAGAD